MRSGNLGHLFNIGIMKYCFVFFLQMLVFTGCQASTPVDQSDKGIQKNEGPIDGTPEMMAKICLTEHGLYNKRRDQYYRQHGLTAEHSYHNREIVTTVTVDHVGEVRDMRDFPDNKLPTLRHLTLIHDLKGFGFTESKKDSIFSLEITATQDPNLLPAFATKGAVLRVTGVMEFIHVGQETSRKSKSFVAKPPPYPLPRDRELGNCTIRLKDNPTYERVN